jgi:hypothetical protein
MDSYEEVDKEIVRMEEGIETPEDATLTLLKKQRLDLKDQIAEMLPHGRRLTLPGRMSDKPEKPLNSKSALSGNGIRTDGSPPCLSSSSFFFLDPLPNDCRRTGPLSQGA